MLDKEFILNFSGLCYEDGRDLSGAQIIDFSYLDGTNCYCQASSADVIRKSLETVNTNALHWIDTGDYHYSSLFFLEKLDQPFTLFLIDNHSDDQNSAFDGDILSCGNWVKAARRLPGYETDYFVREPGDISWIRGKNRKPAYVSIDKDVLSADFARTNWDQGRMTLTELASVLQAVADNFNIVGVDVCGGLTLSKGASDEDFEINIHTDSELRKILLNLMSV